MSGQGYQHKRSGGGATGPTGPQGNPGATGPAGPSVFIPGEDGEEGWPGPPGVAGAQGATGSTGNTGAQGSVGPAVFLEAEAIEGETGPPGPTGATGAAGSNGSPGAQGPVGPAVLFIGEDGDQGDTGLIGMRIFHNPTHESGGDDHMDYATGSYAPGSLVIPTGQWALFQKNITLTGTQMVTVQGTGALIVEKS